MKGNQTNSCASWTLACAAARSCSWWPVRRSSVSRASRSPPSAATVGRGKRPLRGLLHWLLHSLAVSPALTLTVTRTVAHRKRSVLRRSAARATLARNRMESQRDLTRPREFDCCQRLLLHRMRSVRRGRASRLCPSGCTGGAARAAASQECTHSHCTACPAPAGVTPPLGPRRGRTPGIPSCPARHVSTIARGAAGGAPRLPLT